MKTADLIRIEDSIERVDWVRAKAKLAADEFDNGRSAQALRRSFESSQHVAFAWLDEDLVGMARMLSDGVCNAYLLDVWTQSTVRNRGIGTLMVDSLAARVPGQHIGLQTDGARQFYARLGFSPQPEFMSRVVGHWLGNEANHPGDRADDSGAGTWPGEIPATDGRDARCGQDEEVRRA